MMKQTTKIKKLEFTLTFLYNRKFYYIYHPHKEEFSQQHNLQGFHRYYLLLSP